MGDRHDIGPCRLSRRDLVAPLLMLVFFVPLAAPALGLFYSSNDLMNLAYYAARPWETLWSNLVVFTSFRRPFGGAVLLGAYSLGGMNPIVLYLLMPLLLAANMVSLSLLAVRLTGDRSLAALAPLPILFHPAVNQLVYDGGAIYEVLALAGTLAALHCYLSYRQTGRLRWYLAALASFVVALNSKETAVVFPLIVAAYELLFRGGGRWRGGWQGSLLRVVPLAAVSFAYGLAKVLGREAYWRDNAAYSYDFDPVLMYDRLAAYLSVAVGWVRFGDPETAQTLLAVAAVALLLRSRTILFGLAFFLATLAPVLPLPRFWSLFLYLPLAGFGLGAAALLLSTARWVQTTFSDHIRTWASPPAKAVLFALTLTIVLLSVQDDFEGFLGGSAVRQRTIWHDFTRQLDSIRSVLPDDPIIGIRDSPVDPPGMFFTVHHIVRLSFGNMALSVYRLPEQEPAFLDRGPPARRVTLGWQQGALFIERGLSSAAAAPGGSRESGARSQYPVGSRQ